MEMKGAPSSRKPAQKTRCGGYKSDSCEGVRLALDHSRCSDNQSTPGPTLPANNRKAAKAIAGVIEVSMMRGYPNQAYWKLLDLLTQTITR